MTFRLSRCTDYMHLDNLNIVVVIRELFNVHALMWSSAHVIIMFLSPTKTNAKLWNKKYAFMSHFLHYMFILINHNDILT